MENKINVIQYGLGPIGNKITRFAAEKSHLIIAGGIDIDPAKVGKDLGTLAGLDKPLNASVTDKADELLKKSGKSVVVLATFSGLEKIKPQILQVISHGHHVVSTCEELSYPWLTHPSIAKEIDAAAKAKGVAVLGTGVNPGFLMDFLPLAMTGISRTVKKIRIERFQNAAFRRIPFQQKIGAGLTPEQFEAKKKLGTLRHVGLTESMHMIASRLGWKLDKAEDILEPVIAKEKVTTESMSITPGNALGVLQTGKGICKGEEVLTLVFRATIGEPDPRDRIVIDGDPPVDLTIKGGINGDVATCAITVNAIKAVWNAKPGLRTMADIEPVSYF